MVGEVQEAAQEATPVVEGVLQQVKDESITPNELFKKMVINNNQQNNRLSKNFNSKALKSSKNTRFKEDSNDEKNADKSSTNSLTKIKAWNIQLRFIICSMGIGALTMCQMSRIVLNLSITSMIDPSVLNKGSDESDLDKSIDGSCPWPEETSQNSVDSSQQHSTTTVVDGILFYLTTEDQKVSETVLTNEVTESLLSDKFMWSMADQNVLLGAFFYSYFFFQVLGGRMAEMYGAKYVMLLAVAGSTIINLSTPLIARYSFSLLVASRVLLGVLQAGVVPGIYALFSQWLTMSETGIYTSLIKVFFCMGMVLGSVVYGLCSRWEDVFYFTGLIGALWCILWIFIATSNPQGNSWISETELKHIMKKKRKMEPIEKSTQLEMDEKMSNNETTKQSNKKKNHRPQTRATPWMEILTNPSVIGFVLVKLSYNYLLDFVTIELPSYLKYVHHASNQTISLMHTSFTLMQVILVVFVGWTAQSLIRKRALGLSKTVWRKIFQGSCSYLGGFALILLTFNNCNIVYVAIVLQSISFLSMFNVAGEVVLPYDLTDEYPATIAAIGNSIANMSGITTTLIAGVILGDQGGSYDRWNLLIRIIGLINILGGLAFTVLVSTKPIVFKHSNHEKQLDDAPTSVTVWNTSCEKEKSEATFEVPLEDSKNEPKA